MPFTYVVNIYSDMSLSKGHLGSRGGGGSKNKLKDTSFYGRNYPTKFFAYMLDFLSQ